ncbi:MAG: DHH family phosphoesterase [candidate division WOR-3 bacterium]
MSDIDILAQRYAADFTIPIGLAQIIARRFPKYDEARDFLSPSTSKLYPPNTMPDIEEASKEIYNAIQRDFPILIYCHDDPDGYTSATLIYKTICDLRKGGSPEIFIYPINREKDGYVLNPVVLDEYIKKGIKTIITVDFGISNPENFRIARDKGLHLVVCDHHETNITKFSFPAVDPKRVDSKYPFRELAGVGVAFKLSQYLFQKFLGLNAHDYYNLKKEFWAITMLGTIADRVTPISENRIFCYEGLKAINKLDLPWVRYFLKDGPIDFPRVISELVPIFISAAHLDSKLGIELLNSGGVEWVYKTINELKLVEEERKKLIENFTSEAISMSKVFEGVVFSVFTKTTNGLKLHHLGGIASRLRDHFGKTAVVLLLQNGRYFGELRSYKIDLYELLNSMKYLFIDFGGHKRAAGFSMAEGNLDKFIEEVCNFISRYSRYDSEIKTEPEATIDKTQVRILEPLMPFGDGNRAPILTDGVDLYTIDHKFNIIDLGLWQT